MNNQDPKFLALQKKWYAKLEKSGFEDIEDGEHLKMSRGQRLAEVVKAGKYSFQSSKQEYYRLAGFFLYDHTFESTKDKIIWEVHSQGMAYREISSFMLKKHNIDMAQTQVLETIHRLRKKMLEHYRKEAENE